MTAILKDKTKQVSFYDAEKAFTLGARLSKMDSWDVQNLNRCFRAVVRVTGEAYKGFGKDKVVRQVENEVVEIRMIALSNYKGVYLKFSPELFEYFFGDKDSYYDFQKSRTKYADQFWYRDAYHDSCWTEGFKLTSYFTYESKLEILEMGIGTSIYESPKDIKDSDLIWESKSEKEEALLSELKSIDNWEIDMNNKWDFVISLMRSLQKRHLAKAFRVTLTKTEGEKYFERDFHLTFDYEGQGTMVTISEDKKNKTARIYFNPLNDMRLQTMFQGYELNFYTEAFWDTEQFIGREILEYTEAGYKVVSKRFK